MTKTIETKITKNGALLLKVNGKRAKYSDAVYTLTRYANISDVITTDDGRTYTVNELGKNSIYNVKFVVTDDEGNQLVFNSAEETLNRLAKNSFRPDNFVKAETTIEEEPEMKNVNTIAEVSVEDYAVTAGARQVAIVAEIANARKATFEAEKANGNYSIEINGEYVHFKNNSIVRINADRKLGLLYEKVDGKKFFYSCSVLPGKSIVEPGSLKRIAAAKVAQIYMNKQLAAEQDKTLAALRDTYKDNNGSGLYSAWCYITYADNVEHNICRYFDDFAAAKTFTDVVKKNFADAPVAVVIKVNKQGGALLYHCDTDGSEVYHVDDRKICQEIDTIDAEIDTLQEKAARLESERSEVFNYLFFSEDGKIHDELWNRQAKINMSGGWDSDESKQLEHKMEPIGKRLIDAEKRYSALGNEIGEICAEIRKLNNKREKLCDVRQAFYEVNVYACKARRAAEIQDAVSIDDYIVSTDAQDVAIAAEETAAAGTDSPTFQFCRAKVDYERILREEDFDKYDEQQLFRLKAKMSALESEMGVAVKTFYTAIIEGYNSYRAGRGYEEQIRKGGFDNPVDAYKWLLDKGASDIEWADGEWKILHGERVIYRKPHADFDDIEHLLIQDDTLREYIAQKDADNISGEIAYRIKQYGLTREQAERDYRLDCYSDAVLKKLNAELPPDPNAGNVSAAKYITELVYSEEPHRRFIAIRSTDFKRAELALNILRDAFPDSTEYSITLADDNDNIWHAPELDGSEEDDEPSILDSVKPLVDDDDESDELDAEKALLINAILELQPTVNNFHEKFLKLNFLLAAADELLNLDFAYAVLDKIYFLRQDAIAFEENTLRHYWRQLGKLDTAAALNWTEFLNRQSDLLFGNVAAGSQSEFARIISSGLIDNFLDDMIAKHAADFNLDLVPVNKGGELYDTHSA